MAEKDAEDGKGRIEEAAGALLGEGRLKNEDPEDQPKESGKDAVDAVAETLSERRKDEEQR